MQIRPAAVDDLAAIVSIYNHHVVTGRATFDEEPLDPEDRRDWFASFRDSGPHRLVVADDGEVRGYAASFPYRSHPAFAETVELSIYLSPSHTGQGLGSSLYEHLLAELETEAVHRVVVGIALPNEASIRLHRRFGFEDVGVFHEYATKNNERVSSLWMQLRCGPEVGRSTSVVE